MDFSEALARLKSGAKITRGGWNGRGMYVALNEASEAGDAWHPRLPYLILRTVGGEWVPWTVSQTDLLAGDWTEVA